VRSLPLRIQYSGKDLKHLVPQPAKDPKLLLIGPGGKSWIHEGMMLAPPSLTGPDRAIVRGRVTDGDNQVEIERGEILYGLGGTRVSNAELLQDL
jgi:hypothetical protein